MTPFIPYNEVRVTDPVQDMRNCIAAGRELSNSPHLMQYLVAERDTLLYNLSHLQVQSEDDRAIAIAVNTVNKQLYLLEKIYNLVYKLPQAEQELAEYLNRQSEMQGQ